MPVISRYSTTARGAMIITGNTLGLLGTFNPPDATNTSINANGIGAFTSLNTNLAAPGGYPPGTTFNWIENGSDTTINIPTTASILYAELAWSGMYLTDVQDVSTFINNPIIFNTPTGSFNVNPDNTTAGEMTNPTNRVQLYFRSSDVTSLVSPGSGTYSVESVPGALGGTLTNPAIENNYLGWSLIIVYEEQSMPYRNMNVWTIFEGIESNLNPNLDIQITGFSTPISGPVEGRLLVSAGEGDPNTTGDIVSFGPDIPGLVVLQGEPPSPPNNPVNNFFVSRINNGDSESPNVGQIDTSGTFGTLNQPVPTTLEGRLAPGRFGYDITNVSASSGLINGQTQGLIRLSTLLDGYFTNLLGLQVDSNAPNIEISKAGPSSAIVGDNIKYTLTITNTGVIQADTAIVVDSAPNGTDINLGSLNVINATGPVINNSTASILDIDIGPLLPNQTVTIEYTVSTNLSTPSPVLNTANVNFSFEVVPGGPTITDSSVSNEISTILLSADISVVKSALPDPVVAGELLTYTMVVTNAGPSDALDVTLTDNIPVCLLNPEYSVNGGAFAPWPLVGINLGTMTPGQVINVQIRGTVDPSCVGSINNTATVSSPTPDPDPTNNTSTVTTEIETSADISVVKSALPDPVVAGELLTYTMVVTNAGPSDALDVTLTDNIPACLLNPEYSVGGGAFAPWPLVGINLGTMTPGQVINVQIRGTVDPSCVGSINNTATVSSPTPDPDPTNNTSTVTTEIETSADISVVKSALPDPVVAGELLTYTMVVTNAGPSDALDVTLTDNIPACLLNPEYSVGGGAFAPWPLVGINLGTMTPGQVINVQIRGTVDPSCVGSINNTATVSSPTPDPNPTNNTSTVTTEIETSADISVVKSGLPDPVVAGELLTYTMVVTNAGPSDALDVTLTDNIPACLLNPEYSVGGGAFAPWPLVGINLGTMTPGQVINVQIRGTVDPSCVGSINNIATVSSPTPDPNPTNNTSTVTTEIETSADISVVKSGLPDPVVAGELLTYTMVVTNAGPSDALDVTLTDNIPACLLNPEYSVGGGAFAPWPLVGINLGTMTPGQVINVQIRGTVDPSCVGSIENTAVVSSPTPDPNPTNNTSTVTTEIETSADISVVKSGLPDPVVAGELLTYTMVVTNAGPSDALDVTLTDNIPACLLNPEYSVGGGAFAPWPLVGINLGTMTPGQVINVQIRGTVDPSCVVSIENTAVVSSPTPDPNPTNNTSTVTTEIETSADISVVKSGLPDPVVAGELLTYTMVVTNAGPSDALDVTLTDNIPACLLNPEYSVGGGAFAPWPLVGINLGTMTPGQVINVQIRGTVDPSCVGSINNTATVSSPTPDPNPTNNTSTVTTEIETSADISVVKSALPNPVVAGELLTYTMVVTNAGPSNAQNVSLADTIPACLLSPEYSVNGGIFAQWPVGGIILGNMTVGEVITVEIRGTINSECTGSITNIATVSSLTPDPNPANNTSTTITKVNTLADISVVKSALPNPVEPGELLTYTIVVTNAGPSNAQSVTLTDNISTCILNPEYSVDGGIFASWPVSGINLGFIAPGEAITVEIRGTVDPSCTSKINNTAVVSSPTPDPDPTNNTSVTTTEVKSVVISKSCEPKCVSIGEEINYVFTIVNNGTIDVLNINLFDEIPAETSFVEGSFKGAQGVVTANMLVEGVDIGDLAAGKSKVVSFKVKVDGIICGANIINQASITYEYTMDGGETYETSSSVSNECGVTIRSTSFKQTFMDKILQIPDVKPDIENIVDVDAKFICTNSKIIDTPIGTSQEGQSLTGKKLVINGKLCVTVIYVAEVETQTVHTAHFELCACEYIVIPDNEDLDCNINPDIYIEDIFFEQMNSRQLFINIAYLVESGI
ncbi:hypothetical protein TPELB_08870 [Terrisporobacter petrolearius]|uniref:Uncharacterized protein n=1 Tax=Terrisporobacter petrolearius TaxID=1460447 RepID=A0ABZ3FCX2_9FIRM